MKETMNRQSNKMTFEKLRSGVWLVEYALEKLALEKGSAIAIDMPMDVKSVTKDDVANYIFGPKEGDTPDRAKYGQGIKFSEPEIKGDSPELVEYIGMQNLIKALKENLGLKAGKLVFGFEDGTSRDLPWGALDDVVMGGVSESQFRIVPNGGETGGPTCLFRGMLTKLYFVTSTNGS
ncbi:putative complex I intermediate-associated protein 30 [Helianthus anomalus]